MLSCNRCSSIVRRDRRRRRRTAATSSAIWIRSSIRNSLPIRADKARCMCASITRPRFTCCSVSCVSVGFFCALWIKDGLLAVSLGGGRARPALEPRLDWRVLGFTLALSLLTGIVFGLAPAGRPTKVNLTPSLKDGARASTSIHRSFLSRGLVVVQVALSLLLLVGAGLFVRTLVNLQRVDPGFNTQNLLLFGVEPGLIGYKDEKLRQLYQQISERLEKLPQ